MLTTLKTIQYKTANGESFKAEMTNGLCTISNDKNEELVVMAAETSKTLSLTIEKNDSRLNDDLLLVAVEYILGHNSELSAVEVSNFKKEKNADFLLQKHFSRQDNVLAFFKSQFFQLRGLWHADRDHVLKIEEWTTTNDRIHPIRPDIQSGTLYSRYVPSLEKTLSFRMIDPTRDQDIFHDWHNQARVANFWELALPKAELVQYMEKGLKDPHTLPMIAECEGLPIGYFEMYWTREDRLAPYYESESFDRGFHFLIGETSFLGFNNTDAVLKSLTHFLFIDDVRTRKLMAEPRSDNHKVLKYIETFIAWKKLYEFDFPHKRSALLECKREAFFTGNYL